MTDRVKTKTEHLEVMRVERMFKILRFRRLVTMGGYDRVGHV